MPIISTAYDSENSGNFGDCMKGRVRLMTAITPAHAHAYQATCLAQHFPGVPHRTFRLPKPKSRYPYLPNDRSITRERGNDRCGWAVYTDGGTRIVDGETLAGWSVISRSLMGELMSCLVHRGSSRFLWCPNTLQQHSCHD